MYNCILKLPPANQTQMRQIFFILFSFLTIKANSQSHTAINQHSDTANIVITPKLGIQFGTIAKLEVQIFDGESLNLKAFQGTYLLKINSVNGKTIIDSLALCQYLNDKYKFHSLYIIHQ